MRDIAGIANCLFCDSYLMLSFATIELSNYPGKQGKNALYDLYVLNLFDVNLVQLRKASTKT